MTTTTTITTIENLATALAHARNIVVLSNQMAHTMGPSWDTGTALKALEAAAANAVIGLRDDLEDAKIALGS